MAGYGAPAGERARRGNALIEFTLLGIPIIFISLSIVSVSLDMWQFHSLAYSTEMTARYATVHGATCTANTNSCTITIGNMATYYASQALALDPAQVIVNFTDGSGTTTCNPVNSCNSNATQFPKAAYNSIGMDVKVVATYTLKNPFAMFWPPNSDPASAFSVSATSRQRIGF
jgi:Flp pilus assembly protein TadG